MRISNLLLAGLGAGHVFAQEQQQQQISDRGKLPQQKKPNILFILTDDQDLHLESLQYMPKLQKLLVDQGTTYSRHYCTIALCCPSRVSLLTGKAAHNTNVTDVRPPYGGYPKFISQGLNENYLPLWLQDAGYSTHYVGKLMNGHNTTTYNQSFAAGWDENDFLLDPYTYQYRKPAFQHNKDPPVVYDGQYLSDLVSERAYKYVDNAASQEKPFFIAVAPVAPHANFAPPDPTFTEPIPAPKYAGLFKDVIAPRSINFNPDQPSGASWVKTLPKLNQTNLDYNDHYYRQRLRSLQSVDEMIENLVQRLDKHRVLDNTYIIYTSDNGYHIGQHRLQPGKTCGYEEDINVPFIIRGPGVPKGHKTDIVSSHTDIAPTFLNMAQTSTRPDFDGLSIPYLSKELFGAKRSSASEHVNVEFWGVNNPEGIYGTATYLNNTYKAVRIYAPDYNLYYSVWCTNEHELYDLSRDPGQLHNLIASTKSQPKKLLGRPLEQVLHRLDALLLVLKACKGDICRRPWHALQPNSRVDSLRDALSPRFDKFYAAQHSKATVSFSRCTLGQLLDAEGAQFSPPTPGHQSLLTREHGSSWADWV